VISLAGLAFAVGMVVDNGIVVLENIYRHLQMGKPRVQAAIAGTREVWGAVLASTLTTMAVFLPILFIEEEVGQLFRDIAIAISAAVGLSLIVSVTVIPSAAARILKADPPGTHRFGVNGLFGLVSLFTWITEGLAGLVYRVCSNWALKILAVALLTAVSVGMAVKLAPKAEYLPEGNRNMVIGVVLPPPGYNLDELAAIGKGLENRLLPLWRAEVDDPALGGPAIERFYFVTFRRNVFLVAKAKDPTRVGELIPVLRQAIQTVPGTFGVASKTSLFSRSLTQGRSINLEFSGDDLPGLIRSGGIAYGALTKAIPGAQIRPIPSLDLGNPEISVTPDRVRLSDLGFSVAEIGTVVDVLLDGAKASDVMVDGEEIDLTVMATAASIRGLEDLETLPLRTPGGRTVTLGSVARVALASGPEQINRVEGQRTITLNISPPETIALQQAMEAVQDSVAGLRTAGMIPPEVHTRLAGTADKLTATFEVMKGNFLLAILITYLLMASLFESFFFPFVILFSVPLAAGGGFLGLWLVNRYIALQSLDMLTMLGFIILVGTVVNNAILVVHKTLGSMREDGLAPNEALRESVRTRVRPIFMSTTTTVFGMLPLILFPGAGSELYRGIGAVVVGGLALSTVFTLFLVPAVMSLFLGVAGVFRKNPVGTAPGGGSL
jgi:HAE1 family hydrophobic/amphiphilic exporter-1